MRAIISYASGRLFAEGVRIALRAWECEVIEVDGQVELLALVRQATPDLVVIHAEEHVGEALATARRLRDAGRRTPLLLVVRESTADVALAAMRAGINDVVNVDCDERDAAEALVRIVEREAERRPPPPLIAGKRLIGVSRSADQLRHAIQRVAASDANVLITGETGTGKELAAELIHCNSRRREKPFVSINCAAIPDGLLESELFGYERGAFTGAHAAREGKLQYAQGGTLFLDEIGDMNLYAQAKILRALESRKVQRLGANRDIAINVRIVAATNQNLEQLTSQQKFRQDLFFRLNVARIDLPPLRDRRDDIPGLVAHLLAELGPRLETRVDTIDESFLEPLLRYEWPGNVRELRNVIESTLVFAATARITARDLPPYLRALFAIADRKRETERQQVMAALSQAAGNRTEAARLLGCSRMTLYRKMIKYELFSESDGENARNTRTGALHH